MNREDGQKNNSDILFFFHFSITSQAWRTWVRKDFSMIKEWKILGLVNLSKVLIGAVFVVFSVNLVCKKELNLMLEISDF